MNSIAKIKQAKLSLNMISYLGVSCFGEDVCKLIRTEEDVGGEYGWRWN